MQDIQLLWVDDEISSLKPLIIFLEKKGIQVSKASNGYDALDYIKETPVDIVLLDESMPGISGLETLTEIKKLQPNLPVIMVTKNEEEYIMEEAIGSQISDYLIKPVNPNQVWLSLKKQFESKKLVSDKTNLEYQQEFRTMFMDLDPNADDEAWKSIFKKINDWELKLDANTDMEMYDVIINQKAEANVEFAKFFTKNYQDWIQAKTDRPMMSPDVLPERLFPILSKERSTLLLIMDNLRYDQWMSLKPSFEELYDIVSDDIYYSIIPTTTQYARNAIFASMMPLEIAQEYPAEWTYEDEDGGKNNSEELYLRDNLKRHDQHYKTSYTKITNYAAAKKLEENALNYLHNDLNVVVYNFVDMLSHARTEMEVLKELASDDFAYRALTQSWFRYSPLYSFLKKLKDKNIEIILSTDHGSIQVKNPTKIKGKKDINNNLRYKIGSTLDYKEKGIYEVMNPTDIKLPKPEMNSHYVFALEDNFFCYPNNFGYYSRLYKGTYQHGGISMEEILIPIIHLRSKS